MSDDRNHEDIPTTSNAVANGVIRVNSPVQKKGMSPILINAKVDESQSGDYQAPPPRPVPFRADSPGQTHRVTTIVHREPISPLDCSENPQGGSLESSYGQRNSGASVRQCHPDGVHETSSQQQQHYRSSMKRPTSSISGTIRGLISPPPRPKDPSFTRMTSPGSRRTPPPRPPSPNLVTTSRINPTVRLEEEGEEMQQSDSSSSIYPIRSAAHPRAVIYKAPTWMQPQRRQKTVSRKTPVRSSRSFREFPASPSSPQQRFTPRVEREVIPVDGRRQNTSGGCFRRTASLPTSSIRRNGQRVLTVRQHQEADTHQRLPPLPAANRPVRIYKIVNNSVTGKPIEIVREPRVSAQTTFRSDTTRSLNRAVSRSPQLHRYSSLPLPSSPKVIPITRILSPVSPQQVTTNYDHSPYATIRQHHVQHSACRTSNSSAPNSPSTSRSLPRQGSALGLPPVHRARTTNRSIVISPPPQEDLIPLGPAEERVDERQQPETGEVQRVTTRTQSFTDVTGTVRVNEVVEKAEGDQTQETHCWRRTVTAPPNPPPEANSTSANVRHVREEQKPRPEIRAGRTASQTHISGPQSMPANRYASEINLLTTETHRQQSQPYHSTYSAHRENQRRMEEERRRVEAFKASNQHIVENRQVGGGQELTEEMETIALQPIGKGIHDLEPSVETMMRHSRAMTPTPGYTTNVDGTENYRTLASTVTTGNWTREGQMSRDHMYYPTDGRTPLSRNLSTYEGQVQSGQNSQPGLLMDNVSAKLLQQVDASSQDWYMPYVSRNEVCALLRDKEPGSFIVRISQSFKNHFSLGLKIPHDSPNFQLRPTDAASGYVRYFLISPVTLPDGKGNGLAFNGFSNSPAFSSLITLVADHVMHPRHLPCPLRLPDSARGMGSAHMNAGHNYGSTHTAMNCTSTLDHPSYLSGEAFTTPMLFLGTVEIGPNINSESVENGITRMLNQPSSLEKREVYVKFIPREGMKMVDRDGTLVKKAIKAEHIAWVGMDPRGRDFSDPELYAKGMRNAKIFAVVVKKPTAIMTKRNVYAFCERTPSQPAFSLVHYMRSLYPGQ